MGSRSRKHGGMFSLLQTAFARFSALLGGPAWLKTVKTTGEDALLGKRPKAATGAAAISQAVGGNCVDSSYSVSCDNGEGGLSWEKTFSYDPALVVGAVKTGASAPYH